MAAKCVYFPGSRDGSGMFRSASVIMFVKCLERASGPGKALYKKHSFLLMRGGGEDAQGFYTRLKSRCKNKIKLGV